MIEICEIKSAYSQGLKYTGPTCTDGRLNTFRIACVDPSTIVSVDTMKVGSFIDTDVSNEAGTAFSQFVAYEDPIVHKVHHWNPVYHSKLNGKIVTNMSNSEFQRQSTDSGTNFWTNSKQVPIVAPGAFLEGGKTRIDTLTHGIPLFKVIDLGTINGPQRGDSGPCKLICVATATPWFYNGQNVTRIATDLQIRLRSVTCPSASSLNPRYNYSLTDWRSITGQTAGVIHWRIEAGHTLDYVKKWFDSIDEEIISCRGYFLKAWNWTSASNYNLRDYNSATQRTVPYGYLDNKLRPNAVDIRPIRDFDFAIIDDKPSLLWNNLCAEALNSLSGFKGNGIAFLKEIPEQLPTLKSLVKTLQSVPSKKVKAVASAYLAVHYGLKLTIQDTWEIYRQMQNTSGWGLSRVQAATTYGGSDPRVTDLTCVARYQIFYDNSINFRKPVQAFMNDFDLNLTLENVWDMVPYSFVLDWFVNLSRVFETIDSEYTVRSRYVVAAAGQSIKKTFNLNKEFFNLNPYSQVDGSIYTRWYENSVIDPIPGDKPPTNPLHHFVEGAALYISNKS